MADSEDNKNDETTSNDTADATSKANGGLIDLGKASAPEPVSTEGAEKGDSAPADTVDSATAAEPTPKSRSTPVGLLAGIGVLGLLLIGLFVSWNPWFGPFNGSRELDEINDAKESASTTGCEIANTLLSYDYNKIDEFFDAIQAATTGEFARGFAADKEQLRAMFTQLQIVSRAEETSCETEMIGDDQARVRMKGTQVVVSSVAAPGQEQRASADIYMDLEKTDGVWKVYAFSPGSLDAGMPGTQPAPGLEPVPGLEPTPGTEPAPVPGEQPVPEDQTETPN